MTSNETPADPHQDNSRASASHRFAVIVGATVIVLVVVVLGVVAVDVLSGNGVSGTVAAWLSVLGFVLTGGALVVALQIFAVQGREAQLQAMDTAQTIVSTGESLDRRILQVSAQLTNLGPARLSEDMGRTLEPTGSMIDMVDSDEPAQAEPVPDEVLESLGISHDLALSVNVYDSSSIPLKVLGDLRRGWDLSDEVDMEDVKRWEAGEAVAYRRRHRRGNHPWLVRLTDRDDPGSTYLWRVALGGRGKEEPSVTRIAP